MSQHGGTDRLSALFEAASLLSPEPTQEQPDEETEVIEPEVVGEGEEGFLGRLPDVPRPPLKLSREDWERLDDWIREYLRATFDRHQQDYSITDEPWPLPQRALASPAPVDLTDTGSSVAERKLKEASVEPSFDGSDIKVKRFGRVSTSLLEMALTRLILYSKPSHDYLFPTVDVKRTTKVFTKRGMDPRELIERVVTMLNSVGMTVGETVDVDDLSLVMLSKNGTRAVVAVGISEDTVCAPVVIVGPEVRGINTVSDALRRAD
jgi:hypothetical protein